MDPSTYAQMDDEDRALIIQLLQEDAREVLSTATGKGKQREGSETDAQVAFKLFQTELQNAETTCADMRMTRSLQQAIDIDGPALIQAQNEERAVRDDRNLSTALSNGSAGSEGARDLGETEADEDNKETRSDEASVAGSQPEGSDWAAARLPKTGQRRTCDACGDRKHFANVARAPCEHEYCRECLTRLFRDAMVDEMYFPPRCCKQPIPLEENRLFLNADLVQQFERKALELSTPRRTYCHDPWCGNFIPPKNYVNDTATCEECGLRTCMTCKRESHDGDCPNDEQLQEVIQLAQNEGWQRCQSCRGMVELNIGCNHITCRCGFQFCYVCGATWKTCGCDQWDENRLYTRAVEIEARDREDIEVVDEDDLDLIEEQGGREEVRRIMEDLAINHECEHQRWFSRSGPRRCEECHAVMPLFIYECQQCHIMACRRCRFHRL